MQTCRKELPVASSRQQPLIYFHSLELENVRCFGERQILELTDEEGRLAQWTLLLGDSGVGKTTILQCLAWMRPTKGREPDAIEPALTQEENEVLNSLLRTGSEVTLSLNATLSVGQRLGIAKKNNPTIKTGIRLVGRNGQLEDSDLTTNSRPKRLKDSDLFE